MQAVSGDGWLLVVGDRLQLSAVFHESIRQSNCSWAHQYMHEGVKKRLREEAIVFSFATNKASSHDISSLRRASCTR